MIKKLLARIHFIIVMIGWTGLAPWEFEFPFPGSLTSTSPPPRFVCRGGPAATAANGRKFGHYRMQARDNSGGPASAGLLGGSS